MGGVWERVIGILRRILDFFLMDVFGIGLIYEFLLIFFVEVFFYECMIISFFYYRCRKFCIVVVIVVVYLEVLVNYFCYRNF